MQALMIRTALRAAVMLAAFGVAVLVVRFPVVAVLLLLVLAYRLRTRPAGGTSHGSAAFMSLRGLLNAGLLASTGLILGKADFLTPPSLWGAVQILFSNHYPSALSARQFLAACLGRRWSRDAIIRLTTFTHLVSFAPTGRGKGISQVIPTLRSFVGSCLIVDVKGEIFKLTARFRQKMFGHKIALLDPFGVCGVTSDALNPLDFIDHTAIDFLDRSRDLANALILRKGTERDPHFKDAAELILTDFIVFVCALETRPAERTLATVRFLIASKEKYEKALGFMRLSDAAGGVVRALGEQCTWFIEKEGASVMTTLHLETAWLDSPAIAAIFGHSSFDPRALKSNQMDVYLVLPPERIASMPAVMRCWLDCILSVVTRDGPGEDHKILFLLDEIGHLGNIRSLETAVTFMRGYGIRLWFFFQSVAQLSDCFGDRAGKFLDNVDTRIFFGLNALESAETVSKMMGDSTIISTSLNETQSRTGTYRPTASDAGGGWSTARSVTHAPMARPLMRPDEVLRAPENLGFVFHRNLPVIPVRLVKYFEDPEFRDDGTGVSRGLGLSGLLATLLLLASSVGLLFVAITLEFPQRMPPPVAMPPVHSQPGLGRRPAAPLPPRGGLPPTPRNLSGGLISPPTPYPPPVGRYAPPAGGPFPRNNRR